MTQSTQAILAPSFNHTNRETWITFQRPEETREVCVGVVAHSFLANGGEVLPAAHIDINAINEDGDLEEDGAEGVILTIEEARLVRDFLNRPEVQAILDQKEE